MAKAPSTEFVYSDGVRLAYQTFGNGPARMVLLLPFAQNIELIWDCPHWCRWFDALGARARVVLFDKRGTGVSERNVAVPTLDMRMADTLAVMDAAALDRAFVYAVSEGGPLALLLAATHPDRVEGVVLDTSAARLPHLELADETVDEMVKSWGTPASLTVDWIAPSLADDREFRDWVARYERHAASPAGVRDLWTLCHGVDVTEVLPHVGQPVLARHRRGDPVVPIEVAREAVGLLADARLIEFDGADHACHIDPEPAWFDALAAFVGAGGAPAVLPVGAGTRASVQTLGGFAVIVDGRPVKAADWGSRRARQLAKRLVAEMGSPTPRDVLADQLWPDEPDPRRLAARLSVQLSAVRRVLRGGVIVDRSSVRLDLDAVDVDLAAFHASFDAGDLRGALDLYGGPFLPEDLYEDWSDPPRRRALTRFVSAVHVVARDAAANGDFQGALDLACRAIEADPYDGIAHEMVITMLEGVRRFGEADSARARYASCMAELGLAPTALPSPAADRG